MTLEPPVLVVEAVGLRLVEPDEAEQVAGPHPGEQVGDLRRLTGALADSGLGQQDGPRVKIRTSAMVGRNALPKV